MEKGKVLNMPKARPAKKTSRGELSVNCELTYRWLKFSDAYTDAQNKKIAFVDVMTTNIDGADRKLCGLAVSVDDLINILKKIQNS